MAAAAVRWSIHHSVLSAKHGDGMIFGVSSSEQMDKNMAAAAEGTLPETVVDAFETAWAVAKPACEPYFRGYGAAPGGTEAHLALYE
jgi:aflatoxin B1 aldehyde reductase